MVSATTTTSSSIISAPGDTLIANTSFLRTDNDVHGIANRD
jgi:hypothetical protein